VVLATPMPEKEVPNAIPACVPVRNNVHNSILARCVTKVPLCKCNKAFDIQNVGIILTVVQAYIIQVSGLKVTKSILYKYARITKSQMKTLQFTVRV
jgi:hypothetical protein